MILDPIFRNPNINESSDGGFDRTDLGSNLSKVGIDEIILTSEIRSSR